MPRLRPNTSDLSETNAIFHTVKLFSMMAVSCLILMCSVSCHIFTHDDRASIPDAADKDRGMAVNKVDPEVKKLLDKMEAADTAARDQPKSTFSSPTLRVDDEGRIHLYIHVGSVDDSTRELLSDAGAEIELENSEMHVYQAWVPSAAVYSIVEADAVRKVSPPSYASNR